VTSKDPLIGCFRPELVLTDIDMNLYGDLDWKYYCTRAYCSDHGTPRSDVS